MQPWIVIDRAQTPDGTTLTLCRRGTEFAIRAAGQELMSSRAHGSEARLAELGVTALRQRSSPRVLVGGLGCGYTLAAALHELDPTAEVVVSEISAAVVAWNRGVLGDLAQRPLDDPRVCVREGDVIDELQSNPTPFDLILLDVDNGPAALTQARNAWLYRDAGLAQLRSSLQPNGFLAVWSAGPDMVFANRLRAHRFVVSEHPARAHSGGGGKRHVIWLAKRA